MVRPFNAQIFPRFPGRHKNQPGQVARRMPATSRFSAIPARRRREKRFTGHSRSGRPSDLTAGLRLGEKTPQRTAGEGGIR
jgi:hypothetical protein